jgi:hypothetical protein
MSHVEAFLAGQLQGQLQAQQAQQGYGGPGFMSYAMGPGGGQQQQQQQQYGGGGGGIQHPSAPDPHPGGGSGYHQILGGQGGLPLERIRPLSVPEAPSSSYPLFSLLQQMDNNNNNNNEQQQR